jgi:hypothetical protein
MPARCSSALDGSISELLEKRADERRVELLDGQGARRRLQSLQGELEERAEAARVRVARVQTAAALAHEVLAEERFDLRRQRGRAFVQRMKRKNRLRISARLGNRAGRESRPLGNRQALYCRGPLDRSCEC